MKEHPAITSLRGNMLCAIDIETTGLTHGFHEIIQIAVVPVDEQLRKSTTVEPFVRNLRPEHPERASRGASLTHGLDVRKMAVMETPADMIAEAFIEWFQALELPLHRKIIPLAHNWVFEYRFLNA